MSWNHELLLKINTADDLKIAPYHPDMQTTGTPTWIWEVVVENRLFVRAYTGIRSKWYQAALSQKAGMIHAAGHVLHVKFTPIDEAGLNQKIDEAYRHKYAQSSFMTSMLVRHARNATVEILPQ
ncbi:DUF2255 family protein [Pantoea sp. T14]|jgi:hypothetical protein|uniref:DUF2255 family protein n=1 Tax=Pantoea sp. T14 TaxID=3085685 RepID=UPI002FCC0E8A